jgi:hypothetical protein
MKFVRVVSRLALLSPAAGAFAALTGIYGASARSLCQIGSGAAGESIVRRDQKPVVSQNSLVKISCWQPTPLLDASYCDCGSRLHPAAQDNQFRWAYTRKQRLPNHW